MTDPAIHRLEFPDLHRFHFDIKYSDTDRRSHVRELDAHTHAECEIYVNLTGEVSFMVNDRVYPLQRGDAILARPGEYHHCIYRSDARHRFYWILFSCEGNEASLEPFFGHPHVNFVSPPEDQRRELIELCRRLYQDELTAAERYICFFRMLHILRSGHDAQVVSDHCLPAEIADMLRYIDRHLAEPLPLSDIAQRMHVSESTVRRQFQTHLSIKPAEFIRKKRMFLAAKLLREGESVLNAGLQAGYSDNSHFIKLFKQYYGITPLQYRKKHAAEQ